MGTIPVIYKFYELWQFYFAELTLWKSGVTHTLPLYIFAGRLSIVHRHRRSVWGLVNSIHWMCRILQQHGDHIVSTYSRQKGTTTIVERHADRYKPAVKAPPTFVKITIQGQGYNRSDLHQYTITGVIKSLNILLWIMRKMPDWRCVRTGE